MEDKEEKKEEKKVGDEKEVKQKEKVAETKEATKHKVSVDYAKPLKEMIKAGNLQYADANITDEHFPINPRPNGELEVQLIQFDKTRDSGEASAELGVKGLRPVELSELLAFAAAHPDEQKKGPIVALGSQWQYPKGSPIVPYLWSDAETGERTLNLVGFYRGWGPHYRFAGVRKETEKQEATKEKEKTDKK